MTGRQIYKACWAGMWLICLCASLAGVAAGNGRCWMLAVPSVIYACMWLTDAEGGESLREMMRRKINSKKETK